MLTYVAELPISLLVPSVNLSIGSIGVSFQASLQGNLALNASLSASPPNLPDIETNLEDWLSRLNQAIVLSMPSVSFSLSDAVTLEANLNASFGLLAILQGLLSASIGTFAFAYEGISNAFGAAVTSELATQWPDGTPSSGACNAIILGATFDVTRSPPNLAQTQLAAFLNGLTFGPGLVYTGKIGLDALTSVTLAAIPQGTAGIQTQLKAAAALKASAQVTPPTLPTIAIDVGAFLANLQKQFALPNVKFALAATASAAAGVQANFGALASLGAALNRADAQIFAYLYSGAANAMGTALTSALASNWPDGLPTTGACTAVLLGSTDAFTWSTLQSFFNGI